tara:strand:+ start:171 stop:797 length:627 start_codon:yes stop_codon:yes gene_type:complete
MTKHSSFNELPIPLGINNALNILPFPIQESYRHYRLCFCERQEMCIGEIFKDAERLAYCESIDIESARQYCRQIVDQHLMKQSMSNSHIKPTVKKLTQAMQSIESQTDHHCKKLLTTHLKNKNQAIGIDLLKTQGGFHSTTEVFLSYAAWARSLCDALAYLPSTPTSGKDPYLSLVIHDEETDITASSGLSLSLQADIYQALLHAHTL